MIERECLIMDRLIIMAKHGHREGEQPFRFDLKIFTDFKKPIEDDHLRSAISFAEVSEFITEVTTNNSFNLLEKLASEVAKGLMAQFPTISEIHIRVRKTRPGLDFILDALGVEMIVKREG